METEKNEVIRSEYIEDVKIENVELRWIDAGHNHVHFVLFPDDISLSFEKMTSEWNTLDGYMLKTMTPKFAYIGIHKKHPSLEALVKQNAIPDYASLTINYTDDSMEIVDLKGKFTWKSWPDESLCLSWGNSEIGLEQYLEDALNKWKAMDSNK